MYSEPYIFFHTDRGFRWRDGTNPALHSLTTLDDVSKDLLPSLTINVSMPNALFAWLNTNSADLITDLTIILNASSLSNKSVSPSSQEWCRVFDKMAQNATNIQHLEVYWDAEGPLHIGLGRSVVFIRGLVSLKVKKSIEIKGFYAKHWPEYIEEQMGIRPFTKQTQHSWVRSLNQYQMGTERLDPRIKTEDDPNDLPCVWQIGLWQSL